MPVLSVSSRMILAIAVVFKLIFVIVVMLRWTMAVRMISTELQKLHVTFIAFFSSFPSPFPSSLLVWGGKLLQLIQWTGSSCSVVCLPLQVFWARVPPAKHMAKKKRQLQVLCLQYSQYYFPYFLHNRGGFLLFFIVEMLTFLIKTKGLIHKTELQPLFAPNTVDNLQPLPASDS